MSAPEHIIRAHSRNRIIHINPSNLQINVLKTSAINSIWFCLKNIKRNIISVVCVPDENGSAEANHTARHEEQNWFMACVAIG